MDSETEARIKELDKSIAMYDALIMRLGVEDRFTPDIYTATNKRLEMLKQEAAKLRACSARIANDTLTL